MSLIDFFKWFYNPFSMLCALHSPLFKRCVTSGKLTFTFPNWVFHFNLELFCSSTTPRLQWVQFLTRMKIVDDSQLARDGMTYKRHPRIIHVYNKKRIGTIGDRILLAIKGQKQKAIIVGCKNNVRRGGVPSFDTNNCVLVDDQNTPLGARITVPIPSLLRSNPNCSKLVAIATRFV